MKASEMMDLVVDLEHRYAVDRWTIDDLHVWPLLRMQISFDLFYAYHTAAMARRTQVAPAFSRGLQLMKQMLKFGRSFLADFEKNAWPNKRVDVVLFSDGVSYVPLDGVWHERFCDPLSSLLRERGRTSILISPFHEYYVPRRSASIFIQPCLDLIKVRNHLCLRQGVTSRALASEYDAFCTYLNGKRFQITVPDLRWLHKYAAIVRGISKLYQSILRRTSPRAVFIVGYYSIEGMAATFACRKLGIASVDIQHGRQGDLHPAYASWTKVPESGYGVLPTYFWCWSESEAKTIGRWTGRVERWHKAVVGGNVWLDQWRVGGHEFVYRYDRRIGAVLSKHPGCRHILAALQVDLADEKTLAPVLEAMRCSPSNWRWWVRLHPTMTRERDRIRRMLNAHGITDFELDVATDYPLYAVLRHVDVHVTHSSSTVIEAEQFGVPSVIFSEVGAEFFPEQIQSGCAVTAYAPPDIVRAIEAQLKRRDTVKAGALGRQTREAAALQEILARGRQLPEG